MLGCSLFLGQLLLQLLHLFHFCCLPVLLQGFGIIVIVTTHKKVVG